MPVERTKRDFMIVDSLAVKLRQHAIGVGVVGRRVARVAAVAVTVVEHVGQINVDASLMVVVVRTAVVVAIHAASFAVNFVVVVIVVVVVVVVIVVIVVAVVDHSIISKIVGCHNS